MPGAVASTDCFHLFWDRCPQQLKVDCRNGRYNRCTLVWSIVNDHHRRIYSISEPFHGCTSDKTISHYDSFLQTIHKQKDPLFRDAKYKLLDAHGEAQERAGVWVLCDNGYHKWDMMMMPPTKCINQDEVIFREIVESARCVCVCVRARACLFVCTSVCVLIFTTPGSQVNA